MRAGGFEICLFYCFWNSGTVSFQHLLESRSAQRLGKEAVHPRINTFFDVAFLGEGCKCNDRSRVAHLSNEACALQAVKVGHLVNRSVSNCRAGPEMEKRTVPPYLDIHEDQIEELRLLHAFFD